VSLKEVDGHGHLDAAWLREPDNRTGRTMPTSHHPSRRVTLLSAAALLVAGTAGCKEAPLTDRALVFASLDDAQRELDRLVQASTLQGAGVWNWSQTLSHCAQSIEYSMSGFPQEKPAWFQRSVGALAFHVFTWRARMSHDLADPIPGAPPLVASLDGAETAARLRAAIVAFRNPNQPLRRHFAYGELDRRQYEQAHAMHLANHFSAFDVPA